jgi:hypothetical protein
VNPLQKGFPVLLALSLFVSEAYSEPPALSLLRTGSFHGGEVRARSGERWIGLFPSGEGFAWRLVTLITRRVEDPLVDIDGAKSGIEVAVKQGVPVLLLKGLDGIATKKPRVALYSQEGITMPEGEPLELTLAGDANYKLRIVNRRLSDDSPLSPSRLLLESADRSQTLYEWPSGFLDQHCELIWAGDLDGDGKLDLFMTLSDHYNVNEYTLFLSSKRSKGNLVQRVAAFTITGC